MVEVVHEELLHTVAPEAGAQLVHLGGVQLVEAVGDPEGVAVLCRVGREGREECLGCKLVPRIAAEPRMLLDLLGTCSTKSLSRAPLKQPVDQIERVGCPALWQVLRTELRLPRQYLLAHLAPAAPRIGAAAHHALVDDDAERVVVNRSPVRLAADDFGCHVARRAAGFLCVVAVLVAGNS